ncbi:MAG: AAA family ATPase [Planctomycetes bacterium]|nr:AAA family ATPase [Planctomycetota bacterium]
MYETYYNLACQPFANTPNSRFFFETDQHKEALAKLEYTVRNRRGFALITGEIGSGKTTLTRTLIRRLGSEARVALINNTRVTSAQLLRLIAGEFQIQVAASADKSVLLTAIRKFVEQQHSVGRTVVIIIDEGQCLSIDEFEEIRLLTNLETETEKLVQLLILGQPELRATLKHARLAPLIQRIVMYMHLMPMSFDDMTRYIAFRLVRASKDKPNVDFSRNALEVIYEYSKGVPRIVNLVCDNALLVGYSNDTRLIDSKIIRRAITQMLPNFDGVSTDLLGGEDEPARQELDDGRRI